MNTHAGMFALNPDPKFELFFPIEWYWFCIIPSAMIKQLPRLNL